MHGTGWVDGRLAPFRWVWPLHGSGVLRSGKHALGVTGASLCRGFLCSLVPSLFLYISSFPAQSLKPALLFPLQHTCRISGTCTFVSSLTSTQLHPGACTSLSHPYYLPTCPLSSTRVPALTLWARAWDHSSMVSLIPPSLPWPLTQAACVRGHGLIHPLKAILCLSEGVW